MKLLREKRLKLKKDIINIAKKRSLNLKDLKKFDSIQIVELMMVLEKKFKVKLNFKDFKNIEEIIKKLS